MQPPQRQHTCYVGSCTSHRTVLASAALLEAFHSPTRVTPPVLAPTALSSLPHLCPGRTSSRGPLRPGHPQGRGPSLLPTSPAPRLLTGQRIRRQAQLQGLLLPGGGVYIDLNPGTPGEGWPAGSGCPGQPILAPQGLIIAENGPCCAGQAQGTGVGS